VNRLRLDRRLGRGGQHQRRQDRDGRDRAAAGCSMWTAFAQASLKMTKSVKGLFHQPPGSSYRETINKTIAGLLTIKTWAVFFALLQKAVAPQKKAVVGVMQLKACGPVHAIVAVAFFREMGFCRPRCPYR
jgi:hypothetical protein